MFVLTFILFDFNFAVCNLYDSIFFYTALWLFKSA